ncbi:unnamed protein product, partial [Rotaria sordida]
MNRFIRFKYDDKKLQPIDDYKDESISSIDLALQSVLSIVDRLDHYIEDAKHFRHYPSDHGLTEDESIAIYLYTNDWNDQCLNRVLNNTLQSKNHTTLKSWLSFLKLFNGALKKLPTVHDTTIWRGLTIDLVEKLNKNENLILCTIISCSSSRTIIEHLLDDTSVLCSIKSFSGIQFWPNNSRYEGNFIDDKKHGYGIYFYTDRDRYMGEWHNDEPNGKGLLIWSNGTYYQGEFTNGKKHGYGKIIFANGQIQEGEWRND